MTPKEKASEIFNTYFKGFSDVRAELIVEYSKMSSLIFVSLLIKHCQKENIDCNYWCEVIEQIDKI